MTSQSDDGVSTLVLIVHGWAAKPKKMEGVKRLVEAKFGSSARILMPRLPHACVFSLTRVAVITRQLIELIDEEVAIAERQGKPFDRIVLVGHSMGATITRRVYLVARNLPENFKNEAPLDEISARPWAERVERIVMIAAINRGWQVSGRLRWLSALILNAIGVIGHLWPVPNRALSVFDMRLGASFIVQTRLHWLAHHRAVADPSQKAEAPLVIQLIGTVDDIVSPLDQVDIAIDETFSRHSAPGQRYFYVELPHTDHRNAIFVDGRAKFWRRFGQSRKVDADIKAIRAQRIGDALIGDVPELKQIETNSELLLDQIPPIDRKVQSVVFVIHGIRDDGFWTHRIAQRVKEEQAVKIYKSWTPSYGYFAMAPFILPWVRRVKVEWLMDQFVTVCAQYPKARAFDYVGHSNGTYLAAQGLAEYPAFKLRRIYFAGSVVRRDYDWVRLINDRRVETVLNVRASTDWVVALFPKSVEWIKSMEVGGAGFDGFEQVGQLPEIRQLEGYVEGNHSAALREEFWPLVADFIKTGNVTPPTEGVVDRPATWLWWLSRANIGIPGAVTLILGTGLAILSPILCHIHSLNTLSPAMAILSVGGFFIYSIIAYVFLTRV